MLLMCWIIQSYNFDSEKVSCLYGESICVWILCGALILRFLMHSNSQNVNADSVIGDGTTQRQKTKDEKEEESNEMKQNRHVKNEMISYWFVCVPIQLK